MAVDSSYRTSERQRVEALKKMLVDQVAALGHQRPDWASLIRRGDLLLLVLSWEAGPTETLPEYVVSALAEVVVIDQRRQLEDLRTAVTADGCRAMVSFVLGAVQEDPERGEALRNWSAQVRRAARAHRAQSQNRRQELARLRVEVSLSRLAVTRRFPAEAA